MTKEVARLIELLGREALQALLTDVRSANTRYRMKSRDEIIHAAEKRLALLAGTFDE